MDPLNIFCSLTWGFIGFGFLIYGRKQRRPVPMIGGILLMASTYFGEKPLTLSLTGIAIVFGIFVLNKRF